MIKGRILSPGSASGQVLLLVEPLSFWGGFDPRTGRIIDIHHPQCRENLRGRIILMAETRGSGTASGAIAEAIRLGTAPSAFITVDPDINIAIGATVAGVLYGRTCPILAVDPEDFEFLSKARGLTIFTDGTLMAASS